MSTEITSEFVWHNIPPRPRDSHKGSFGTVLAVAGSAYYRGAALLAAEGALRTGAGIVTLASVEPVLAAAVARLPECCLCPCVAGAEGGISPESIPQLQRQKATVLLLGPGLGGTAQSTGHAAETRTLVQKLLPGFAGSAVLDADGLNAAAQLLAEGKTLPHPAGELIVTPHPGEMARLTGLSVAQINADRENTACQYAEKWNAVVVLKGCRTVVAAPDGRVCTNPTGNPGLARGGSGDVLAGMTAALLACGLPAYEAAACAVYQPRDKGLNGNEKIEQAVAALQQEPTQEQLAHTLTVIRRRIKEHGQLVVAVEPNLGSEQMQLRAIRTADGASWWYAFTSFEEELKGAEPVQSTFLVDMEKLFDAALAVPEISGIILNPWNRTIQLDKTLIRIIKGA